MPNHLYKVGASVTLDSERLADPLTNIYVIEAQMPPVGTLLQYRIKSEAEGFRRVVVEHRLSALSRDPILSPLSRNSPLPSEAD